MKPISKHITYEEATRSEKATQLGLKNDPNEEQLICMQNVAEHIFEPLREYFKVPIYISSFFRSIEVNHEVGGAQTSKHLLGQAMDIDADMFGKITNKQIFDYIRLNLDFDQLIDEAIGKDGTGGWVHCSYVSAEKNRHSVLTLVVKNGKQSYEVYKG
jgi:zinc D-Ala-D-Ala carboxypeptidase